VVIGAGAYQISSIIDTQLASLLEEGAVAVLGYAQLLAVLPVSLFGISVAAVALPELSRDAAKDAGDALRERLATGARRVAYFAVPSAVALAVLAEPLVAALFETGAFGAEETTMTAAVVAAYAMAVPAQAVVKLFASGHYALGDTRTPVKIAILSVALSAGAAFWLMGYFGPAGIAAGAAVGGYANSVLNFGALRRRLGSILSGVEHQAILAAAMATVPAALAATLAARLTAQAPTVLTATVGLATFGLTYGAATLIVRHPDALALVARWRARA
jgi:putative peptidoglycan lipid II flippase